MGDLLILESTVWYIAVKVNDYVNFYGDINMNGNMNRTNINTGTSPNMAVVSSSIMDNLMVKVVDMSLVYMEEARV